MTREPQRQSLSRLSSRRFWFRTNRISKSSGAPPSETASTDSESDVDMKTPGPARPPTSDYVDFGFSFSGGGWLMIYMYGVAKALRERGADRNARFIGTSAGSMGAMGLFLGADFDKICEAVIANYLPIARASLRGAFRVREFLQHAMVAVGNVQNWEMTKVDPRACQVVYTSLSAMKSRRKSTFESQEDLVDALMASCTATPIAGFPFKYKGEWVMDGGVFDNQPLFTAEDQVKRTVTITPNVFDRTADIKPSKYIPPWWSMYPPTEEDLRWVFALGYEDGLAWCEQNGFEEAAQGRIFHRHTASTGVLQPAHELVQQTKVAQYKTLLGQILGYPIFEEVGNVCTFTGKISTYSLLKVELLVWMLLEVGLASIDAITVWWTTVVAVAMGLLCTREAGETFTIECVFLCVSYVVVCGARVHHKSQEVRGTCRWKLVEASLEGMKSGDLRAGAESAAKSECQVHSQGMRAIQARHASMAKDHHDVLVEHSLLYRISTLLYANTSYTKI